MRIKGVATLKAMRSDGISNVVSSLSQMWGMSPDSVAICSEGARAEVDVVK